MKKPQGHQSLADEATFRLKHFIIKKKYSPGDLLPGEIELAEECGVSRTIIREALSRFRMMGIIDSRRRRGMVLQQPDFLKGMELAVNHKWLEVEAMKDLFEFRLMLEVGLADFLYGERKEKLIERLDKIVIKEENADTERERLKMDAAFHSALYKATGNRSLVRLQKVLLPLFKKYASKRNNKYSQGPVTHRQLIDELRSGTPESFREAMRLHLDPHFQID